MVPDLIYEIFKHLDYPDIVTFCAQSPEVYSICLTHHRVRWVIFQKYVDNLIEYHHGSLFSVLIAAAKHGNVSVVNEMLRRGVDPSCRYNKALAEASQGGHLDVVKRLLQDDRVNLNVHYGDLVHNSFVHGHYDVARALIADRRFHHGNEMMFRMSIMGDYEAIDQLIDLGVDPSFDKNIALRVSIYHGYTKIIERLLSDPRVASSIDDATKGILRMTGFHV